MDKNIQKKILIRLNKIGGQVKGLRKMIEDEKYCIDIITQSSAIRSALSSVEDLILENHLSGHVIHQMKKGEYKKVKDEIMKVYKLKRK